MRKALLSNRIRWTLALAACLLAACGGSTAPDATADGANCTGSHWVAAWSTAQQASSFISGSGLAVQEFEADVLANKSIFPNLAFAQFFDEQSLRLIVAPHLGGSALRLHFSNSFQNSAVTLAGLYIGLAGNGASVEAGSNQPITFGGQSTVSIAPGTEAISDPVSLSFAPFQNLAVSFEIAGLAQPVDYHLTAQQVSYMSDLPGSYGASEDGAAFTTTISSWYALDTIDVMAPAATGAVVAFGDSLTDGYLSSYNQNTRWPDDLSRRLLAQGGHGLSVLNAGISGNYIATSDLIYGPSGVSRFAGDALAKAGVTDVILLEGINDIGNAPNDSSTAESIIASYQTIISQAHAAGLNIVGATLLPAEGAKNSNAGETGEPQQLRQTVNEWIRTSGAFDAVADFDAAVRNPANPDQLAAQYDGGDHLHLTDSGYQALADAVDLRTLKGTGCR